jgi:hypothetical protein
MSPCSNALMPIDRSAAPVTAAADVHAPVRTCCCWLVLDGVIADVVVSAAALRIWRANGSGGARCTAAELARASVAAELRRCRARPGERWSVSVGDRVAAVRLHPRGGPQP